MNNRDFFSFFSGYKMEHLVDIVRHTVDCHPTIMGEFHERMSWKALEIRAAHLRCRHDEAVQREEERRRQDPPAACTRSKCRGKPSRD